MVANCMAKKLKRELTLSYPIEDKIVIAVASSALFELNEADAVFREKGVQAFFTYWHENEKEVLKPDIALPFVRCFLDLNKVFPERQLAEVLLLCKTIIRAGKTVESVHLDSAPLFYRPALGLLG